MTFWINFFSHVTARLRDHKLAGPSSLLVYWSSLSYLYVIPSHGRFWWEPSMPSSPRRAKVSSLGRVRAASGVASLDGCFLHEGRGAREGQAGSGRLSVQMAGKDERETANSFDAVWAELPDSKKLEVCGPGGSDAAARLLVREPQAIFGITACLTMKQRMSTLPTRLARRDVPARVRRRACRQGKQHSLAPIACGAPYCGTPSQPRPLRCLSHTSPASCFAPQSPAAFPVVPLGTANYIDEGAAMAALGSVTGLQYKHYMLVPKKLEEKTFWVNFFTHLTAIIA